MTRHIIIVIFILLGFSSNGQKAKLVLKIDGTIVTNLDSINVFFKTNGRLISILNKSTSTIFKPVSFNVDSIESIIVVIQKDTLEFFDKKSVLENNFPPLVKETLMPKYGRMTDSDVKWDIYLDNYPFEHGDVNLVCNEMLEEIKSNKKKVQFVVLHILNSQVGHRIRDK